MVPVFDEISSTKVLKRPTGDDLKLRQSWSIFLYISTTRNLGYKIYKWT